MTQLCSPTDFLSLFQFKSVSKLVRYVRDVVGREYTDLNQIPRDFKLVYRPLRFGAILRDREQLVPYIERDQGSIFNAIDANGTTRLNSTPGRKIQLFFVTLVATCTTKNAYLALEHSLEHAWLLGDYSLVFRRYRRLFNQTMGLALLCIALMGLLNFLSREPWFQVKCLGYRSRARVLSRFHDGQEEKAIQAELQLTEKQQKPWITAWVDFVHNRQLGPLSFLTGREAVKLWKLLYGIHIVSVVGLANQTFFTLLFFLYNLVALELVPDGWKSLR